MRSQSRHFLLAIFSELHVLHHPNFTTSISFHLLPPTFVSHGCSLHTSFSNPLPTVDPFKKNQVSSSKEFLICFCRTGELQQAVEGLNRMDRIGLNLDASVYIHLLRSCLKFQHLSAARVVHSTMIVTGFKPGLLIGNLLMDLYTKCGQFADAHKVFYEMPERNLLSWNIEMSVCLREGDLRKARKMFDEMPERTQTAWDSMLRAYLKNGESKEVLRLLGMMRVLGFTPSPSSFSCGLNACGNLADLKLENA